MEKDPELADDTSVDDSEALLEDIDEEQSEDVDLEVDADIHRPSNKIGDYFNNAWSNSTPDVYGKTDYQSLTET